MSLDRVGVGQRSLPLGLLVIEVWELEAGGLVGDPEVLVDQREPELIEIDGSVRRLDRGHCPESLRETGGDPRATLRGRRSSFREHAEGGHDDRQISRNKTSPSKPWMNRQERQPDREEDREPLPARRRRIAKAEAGEEEEHVRGDAHGWVIPRRRAFESPVVRRGSQDSNLGPAVLETAATTS